MLHCMGAELISRKKFLGAEPIQTVYLGGGTPTLIDNDLLVGLFDCIHKDMTLDKEVEFTIEANPEDLTKSKLRLLRGIGVNRLSIGIQSFDDSVLSSMNRSHDAAQAIEAVVSARELGFDNISVDIIYGLPGRDIAQFQEDVAKFLALDVQHVSAYQLTIEPRTAYAHQVEKGTLNMPTDELVAEQFQILLGMLKKEGFHQYEVSNFSKEGFISQHNSSYWRGKKYLGIGPSAHSYDGNNRYWNVANNYRYMDAVEKGLSYFEKEELGELARYNEYILTRSRTKWGLDLHYIKKAFNVDLVTESAAVLKMYEQGYTILDGHLRLNEKGILMADGFAADLFRVE
jgi:oxygen-independent coproporphyrinogen-3 oxidase